MREGERPAMRRLWAALAVLACVGAIAGGLFSLLPERRAVPELSLFDYGPEPTARRPVVPDADALGGDDWLLVDHVVADSWGWIDLMGCGDRVEYAALAGIPIVRDRYQGADGVDAFVTLSHVDYGDSDVADRRLGPIRRPRTACTALDLPAGRGVQPIGLPPHTGADIVAYRMGERVTAIVTDGSGRVVIADGARISGPRLDELLARVATHLADSVAPA
jgi:hypothetical protein